MTFEKSATSGVRQKSSSEESSSADAFAPFLGSVWVFFYTSRNTFMDTFTFADAVSVENGNAVLDAVNKHVTTLFRTSSFELHYNVTSSGYAYTFTGIDMVYSHIYFPFETDGSSGEFKQLSFSCATSSCDTVTGTAQTWTWFRVPNSTLDDTLLNPPMATDEIMGQRIAYSSAFPSLGSTTALDAHGTTISSGTIYSGGISINGGDYQTQVVQNIADKVRIFGNMMVDPNHVGQTVDIFVYAEATLPSSESVSYFTLGQDLSILPWDQNSAHLAAFQSYVFLGPTQAVPIYQGTFFYPGTLKVYFGYRLKDGTIVTHEQPIDITINQ